jgi:hypothetical protein
VWCGRPGRQVSRGIETKNLNKNDFLCLRDFKLLNQMKENAMNYCDIFKFIIFV